MICRKTLITACTFVMTAALMLLLTGFAGAVPEEEWNRTYGGPYWDAGSYVQQVPDGGYIILGETNLWDTGEYGATWLIKTDADGNEQWNRTFGINRVDKISPTSDGGYNLKGWSDQNLWIMEIDSKGNEKWNRTTSMDKPPLSVINGKFQINSFKETADGGFIYAGFLQLSESHDDWHVRLVKVDKSGNEQWNMTSKRLKGDIANSVQQTSDGGYIVTGATGSGNGDVLIIKTDANGNQQWNRTFGGIGTEQGFSVLQASDQGYFLAGYTWSYGTGGADVWLIKTDPNGIELWNRTFGGINDEYAFSIQPTSDNGYILTGSTKSYGAGDRDAWVLKTDASGNEQWNKTFGGEKRDEINFINETSRGDYILAGYTLSYGAGGRDAWAIRIREPRASALDTIADMNKPAEKSTPGFEIFGAMISTIILFYLMRKRT